MGEIDTRKTNAATADEEDLFLEFVIQDEYDLLYLDTYLRETFAKRG